MKSLTRRILVSLVLSAVTLFSASSIYASCMFNVSGELGDGFCSCGSSAGPYCMIGGADVTDDIGTDGMHLLCDMMCPGVPYQTKNTTTPSTPRMFTYPKSYQVARANRAELQRLQKTGSASPFVTPTLYELVLR
jgi:hypothetical protein